jgi:predicted ABC-class ATPase
MVWAERFVLFLKLHGESANVVTGGAFNINAAGQEVLPRTSAMVESSETIELRFTTSLPAAGRSILGQQARQILGVNLVELVRRALVHSNLDQHKLQTHVLSVERQRALRAQLKERDLIVFIANGSILPRASGVSAFPLTGAVPFQSPKATEVALNLPDGSTVLGMGIPKGITLLTGGGFHGKSTVLEAIELGIYDHIPGDGREMVVTDPTAVKIRAEDGRSVTKVDISPFISTLPGGKDTQKFSTDDASGSTSMASSESSLTSTLSLACLRD